MGENQRIREVLDQLDPECFQILYQFWILDQDEKNIARQLGINENDVRKYHRNCRKKFLSILK